MTPAERIKIEREIVLIEAQTALVKSKHSRLLQIQDAAIKRAVWDAVITELETKIDLAAAQVKACGGGQDYQTTE